jgi:hypothetical protein
MSKVIPVQRHAAGWRAALQHRESMSREDSIRCNDGSWRSKPPEAAQVNSHTSHKPIARLRAPPVETCSPFKLPIYVSPDIAKLQWRNPSDPTMRKTTSRQMFTSMTGGSCPITVSSRTGNLKAREDGNRFLECTTCSKGITHGSLHV